MDGRLDTAVVLPGCCRSRIENLRTIEITLAEPLTARSCSLVPRNQPWAAQCELQAADADGQIFRPSVAFRFDRSNMKIHVGPMPRGPVTVSFPAGHGAKRFAWCLQKSPARPRWPRSISRRPRGWSRTSRSSLARCIPRRCRCGTPTLARPDRSRISRHCRSIRGSVIDLTNKMSPDGTLRWDVPPGEWVVLRIGMTTTGTRNSPASPGGPGPGSGQDEPRRRRSVTSTPSSARFLRRMPR